MRRIHEAIAEVLGAVGRPLTPQEVHAAIVERGLYTFNAADPVAIVRQELRRACVDLDFLSARKQWKRFGLADGGTYKLLDQRVQVGPTLLPASDRPEDLAGPLVSAPSDQGAADESAGDIGPSHSEMQYRLLKLGSDLGLFVWAPLGDRGRPRTGGLVGDVPGLLTELQQPFNPAVRMTIGNIDVLWVDQDGGIVAGFEVEHTTPIYSGLLRMCDLLTLSPNFATKFYLVAPDGRAAEYERQVRRPTFARLKPPLDALCKFVRYGRLLARLEETKSVVRHLRPEFLDDIAEAHPPEAGE